MEELPRAFILASTDAPLVLFFIDEKYARSFLRSRLIDKTNEETLEYALTQKVSAPWSNYTVNGWGPVTPELMKNLQWASRYPDVTGSPHIALEKEAINQFNIDLNKYLEFQNLAKKVEPSAAPYQKRF